MKNLLRLLLLTIIIDQLTIINCAAQHWLWATEPVYQGSQSADGEGISLATDPSGNVFETGFFSFSTMQFGSTTMTANNGNFYLVKYDTSGNVLWAKQGAVRNVTYGQSKAYSVSSDRWGNAYVTGFFGDTLAVGPYTLTTALKYSIEMFLVKYDPNGNVLWARQSEVKTWTGNPNWGTGSVTDKDGSVYITGEFNDTTSFGSFSLGCPLNYSGNVFLVKYDSSGHVVWASQGYLPSTHSSSVGNGVAIDAQGNLFITGGFKDTLIIGSTMLVSTNESGDIFVAKFDPNGNPLWCRQSINHSHNNNNFALESGNSVAADPEGNVYITGNFNDTIAFGGDTLMNPVTTSAAGPYGDMFVVKYDGNGNEVWAKAGQPITRASYNGYGIVADTLGHLYFTGTGVNDSSQFNPLNFSLKFGNDTFTISGSGTPSIEFSVLIQLDAEGNVLCGAAIPLGGDDWSAIAVDPSGRYVYMGSDYLIQYGSVTIGPSNLSSNNNQIGKDEEIPFVARWSPCNTTLPLLASVSTTDANCSGLCNGAATVKPTGGVTPYYYAWNTNPVDTTPTASGLCKGSYTVTVTDHAGNTTTAAGTVRQPTPIVVTVGPDTSVCSGNPVSLKATGATSYKWTPTTGLSDTTGAAVTATPAVNITYMVTGTTGSCSATDSVTIKVTYGGKAGNITAPKDSICTGSSVNLTLVGDTGLLQWQLSVDGVNFTNIPSADSTVYPAQPLLTSYYRVIAGTGSCADTSLTHKLVVDPLPVPVLTAADTIFCSGDSTPVCTSHPFLTYLWNTSDTTACTIVNSAGAYWVTVTDANHCSAVSPHQQINVYPVPSVSIIQQGDTLSSFGQVSYQWIRNGVPIHSATGSFYVARQPGWYAVEVTDTNGCITTSEPVSLTTGLPDLIAEESISVYPNPSNGSWQLTVGNSLLGSTMEIFDEQGRLVFQSLMFNLQSVISLPRISPGIYYLHISSDKVSIIKKLIKL